MERLTTKVTNINGQYHCRLFKDKMLVSEYSCKLKEDISYCIAEMLRWYDKCGGFSKMASASRDRWQKRKNFPTSKIKKIL